MIAKISATRSTDPGGFVRYLFGKGKKNEHVNPHTVAGSVHYPGAGAEVRGQVIADLQLPKVLWPKVEFPGGHIWHVALSLDASEGQLSDAKWERIAHDYMQEMKLEDPVKGPLRWTAVHHGVSAEGNDHIHIVANLIREDGTKASIWQDQVRSQKVLAHLEQVHGLKVLQSRHATVGAGSVPYTDKEAGKSWRTGQPIERTDLERRVRAAAAAAQSEVDFVQLLRTDQVMVRPYPQSGPVTGYSVAITDPTGGPGRFFQGGQLARDLTLPRLRGAWPDGGGSRAATEAEWRRGVPVKTPPVKVKVGAAEIEVAEQALHSLETDLHLAKPQEFAELSHDLAGAVAAASVVAEPNQRGQLVRASREVGGWAGTKRPVPRISPSRTWMVARLLLAALDPESEQSRALMRRQLIEQIINVLRVHRSSRPMPAITHGRGAVMAEANDDVDGAMSDALTTGAVTALAVSSQNAQERRARQLAAGNRVTQGLFRRFSRQDPDALRPKLPVPKGFRDVFDDDGWAALDGSQRFALDPDRIGRHVTDVDLARPETGPELRATGTQIMLVNDLGCTLGEAGHAAAVTALNRAQAAQLLTTLEGRVGPDKARQAYHDLGLAYRRVVGGTVTYEFPPGSAPAASPPVGPAPTVVPRVVTSSYGYPVDEQHPVATAAGNQPSGDPAKRPAQAQPDKLKDPLQWRTAGESVTKNQAYTLGQHGVPANEIEKINKGWAGVVLTAFETGDVEGHDAMDRALAAMENVAPPLNQAKAQLTQTKNQGPRQT